MLPAAAVILCAAAGRAGAQAGPDRFWISAWATSVQDPLPAETPTGSPPLDALFDFDAIVRDPADTTRVRREYDSGDHIHLNPAGYATVANSIPLAALDFKVK